MSAENLGVYLAQCSGGMMAGEGKGSETQFRSGREKERESREAAVEGKIRDQK